MAKSSPRGERSVETQQISGKVFRFLSTMHPSLSKPERKRYADFDPDKWYPWTADIAGEFTDLMRRSPRDTSFARGLAYAATKGLPEDTKLTPTDVVAGLASLPAAFVGPSGSGFEVKMDRPGFAEVFYRGMPGFSNVCIAIAGELTQRLQAVGARGLEVKHAEGCRLQGGDSCKFEIRWSADPGDKVSAPASAAAAPPPPRSSERLFERPVERPAERVFERPVESPLRPAAAESLRFDDAPASRPSVSPRPAPPSPRPVAAAAPLPTGNSATDLFEQLKVRLEDAERQSGRHAELEAHIAALEARSAELETALAAAQAETRGAVDALADLRRRIRDLVG
jgi:hypothetical protein